MARKIAFEINDAQMRVPASILFRTTTPTESITTTTAITTTAIRKTN